MKKRNLLLLIVMIACFSCKEKYVPVLNTPVDNFLVVEGYINSGTGATNITLSRTTKVVDTASIKYERNALVRVEPKTAGTAFVLIEASPGVYTHPQLTLKATEQYRLYIRTSSGKEYASTYSDVRTTPAIDSVSWVRDNTGVQVYAGTHDALNKTKYYQYIYDETWEFRSPYLQNLKLILDAKGKAKEAVYIDPVTHAVDSTIYRCWKHTDLADITIATSEQLSKDVIYQKPMQFIESGSWKLSELYTIYVKQRALSRENYRYLEQLKKNTEQLGTIFDAQPSDNNGNFRCITAPTEPVYGFVEVTQETDQRLWISKLQVPGWKWNTGCSLGSVDNKPDSLDAYVNDGGYTLLTVPTALEIPSGKILAVGYSRSICVDCTKLGSNKKPSYWPY